MEGAVFFLAKWLLDAIFGQKRSTNNVMCGLALHLACAKVFLDRTCFTLQVVISLKLRVYRVHSLLKNTSSVSIQDQYCAKMYHHIHL